jgi:anaerobic magnesium-protoporphyrin IX monomethyl ester cyclase
VILINASPQNTMKIFESFMPRGIPFGVASLYAVLRHNGKEVYLFDEQMIGDSLRDISKQFPDRHKRLVFGISVLTASYGRALDLASALKNHYPNCMIVFGGVHPSAVPEEVLANHQVDVVAKGEMEGQIVDLDTALTDNTSLEGIPNLYYRSNGNIVATPKSTARVDLNTLPPIPYELFTHPRYNLGVVLSSRGCPYRCIFCSHRVITDARYRFKNAVLIADEIELLYKQYHQKELWFADDDLLVIKDRVYSLLEELRRRDLIGKIQFSFQVRADNTDEKLLRTLYENGFKYVAFGMETGSERVMKVIQKGQTVQDWVDAVKLARRIGFTVGGTFIMGMPTETHEERMETVKFALKSGLYKARFNNATAYPGTKLFEMAKADGGLHIVGRYDNCITTSTIVENPFSTIPLSYVQPGMTEKELKNDILFGFLCMNLNVHKLRGLLTRRPKLEQGTRPKKSPAQKIIAVTKTGFLTAMLVVKFTDLIVHFILRWDCAVTWKDLKLLLIDKDSIESSTVADTSSITPTAT